MGRRHCFNGFLALLSFYNDAAKNRNLQFRFIHTLFIKIYSNRNYQFLKMEVIFRYTIVTARGNTPGGGKARSWKADLENRISFPRHRTMKLP